MQTPQRGRQRDGGEPVAWPLYSPTLDAAVPSPSASSTQSVAQVYDVMEREQEAIVNKLQREISTLKEDRSRSRSRSSSHSSTMSLRPPETRRTRPSAGEHDALQGLRRENDILRRKVADLTMKLAEKDLEIEAAKRAQSGP